MEAELRRVLKGAYPGEEVPSPAASEAGRHQVSGRYCATSGSGTNAKRHDVRYTATIGS